MHEKQNYDIDFIVRLREIQEAYGSQGLFSNAIGVSIATLKNWLSGKTEPNVSALRNICRVSNVTIHWLITGKNPQLLVDEKECIHGMRGYPEVGAEEVLEAVDQLADLMESTGTTIKPKKLASSVRMAAQILADDARKRKAGVAVVELGRLRELVMLLG